MMIGDEMKKIVLIIVVMFMISVLYIIQDKEKLENGSDREGDDRLVNHDEVRAFYFSYLELEEYFMSSSDTVAKRNIDNIISNMVSDNFNLLILQVRPFSDSIYPSKIFPISKYIGNISFDVLDYFIEKAHSVGIKVHAWINPYRISSNKNFIIKENHPAYSFLNTNHIAVLDSGVYYNPASSLVTSLIVSGVEEIVSNYDVDGIHFDDYFYPNGDVDSENYALYKGSGGTLSLKEYRLLNIKNMLSSVYTAIKEIDDKVVFGISPQGNIDNNYSSVYLDVKSILSTSGYVDYIMPQIYFGFDNSSKPFKDTILEWNNLIKVSSIDLIPALALYKSGNTDKYAGNGSNEWINNSDILKRQIIYSRTVSNYSGFAIFRYDFFYNDDKQNINMISEVNNIRSIIN